MRKSRGGAGVQREPGSRIMSDELSAGAVYLAALKQSPPPQVAGAATAPAPVPSSAAWVTVRAPRDTASSIADNKRKSRRQGSARRPETASGVLTWAIFSFSDISLHGCHGEAMSAFRMGR
jgi:hypothetical protein